MQNSSRASTRSRFPCSEEINGCLACGHTSAGSVNAANDKLISPASAGYSLQECVCVSVHMCCIFACFSVLWWCVFVWSCEHPVSLHMLVLPLWVCLFQSFHSRQVFSPLPSNLATPPCSEWASRPVMFAVRLRKEMILDLDLLIEHLSSSGLISSDTVCVCVWQSVCPAICGLVFPVCMNVHLVYKASLHLFVHMCKYIYIYLYLCMYLQLSVSCTCEYGRCVLGVSSTCIHSSVCVCVCFSL